jgi:hypothetical protein
MKLSVLSPFYEIPYFTIEAIRQLLGEQSIAAGTIQTALYRWMKSGQVIQLKKGVYMTRQFYDLHRADLDFLSAVSAILLSQSYISLEYVLQRRGVLTEVTYPISSVTTKHTRVIDNELGAFTYRNIKPELYTGFEISEYLGISFAQASSAKALFDYLFFRLKGEKVIASKFDLAEDLRLNLEDFSQKEREAFSSFVELSKSRRMDHILVNLRKTIWRP